MTVYTLFLYIGIAAIALTLVNFVISKSTKSVFHGKQWFVQYFVGSLLIFSGLVKAVDPLGTAYKMQDYFTEFEIQGLPFMDIMHEYALQFSLIMLVLELVLGFSLILGIGAKKTTVTNLLMMLFFTFLTGFNYLTGFTNKAELVGILEFSKWEAFSDGNIRITDCGCFGDFLKLKPVETFCKDIIFTIMSFYLVFNTSKLKSVVSTSASLLKMNVRNLIATVLILISTVFCFMNFYFDKPMVDFRPFAKDIDLRKAKADCEADAPINQTIFTYNNKKTGEGKLINSAEIADHSYLWTEKDESGENVWVIDSDKTKTKVIKEGCNSQIQYFEYPEILDNEGYSLLVLSGDLQKTDMDAYAKIANISLLAEKQGVKTTALYYYSGNESIESFSSRLNAAISFKTADDKLIKTIVRANPGLVLIKDGKVIEKWHHKHIPDFMVLNQDYMK